MAASPKPVRERDQAYTDFVKSQPCLIASQHTCVGPIDPHHVIPAGGGKTGSKVSDRRQTPLCRAAHDLAKRRDWFEGQFGISFEVEIKRLNALYVPPVKLRAPKVARIQSPSPTKLFIKSCICGRSHWIPVSIDGLRKLQFFCKFAGREIFGDVRRTA